MYKAGQKKQPQISVKVKAKGQAAHALLKRLGKNVELAPR